MTELRERVARAICESTEADVFDELPERSIYRAVYFQQADAAISAVMQDLEAPSEAMVQAGREVPCDDVQSGSVVYSTADEAKAIWTAMLSQYRKEQAND